MDRLFKSESLKRFLIVLLFLSTAFLFYLTLGRYYGYYYDNKFFNLLALDLYEHFSLYLYLGSHYHVPSSVYSYLSALAMFVFGPGDVAVEFPAAISHLATVYLCYLLGKRFFGYSVGFAFALFVAWAPIHLIQIYTMPDLSFAIFLNVAAIYIFLAGLESGSYAAMVLSAFVYALACFQAIYSLLLLPFFALCALTHGLWPNEASSVQKETGLFFKVLVVVALVLALPAYTYLYILFKATYLASAGVWLAITAFILFLLFVVVKIRKIDPRPFILPISFFAVTAALLSYFDLIVQLDYYFFKHTLGHYIEADVAGGYGGRPLVHFLGKPVDLYGIPVRMSVLTSVFEFAGKDFARLSFLNFDGLRHLYAAYFIKAFPYPVRLLFFVGLFGLIRRAVAMVISGERPSVLALFPLFWLASVFNPFVDLGPDYFNIRRIYILPMPYLVAAAGVAEATFLTGVLLKRARMPVLVALILAVALSQVRFAGAHVFDKALSDKKADIYCKLFYGHYYGRSYAELGAFLLNDAPLKENGTYRSALVYTIPEDSVVGRSLPLFNTINWYTQNKIMVKYAFKKKSSELYGTKERLANYLDCLFEAHPGLQTVYFADFVDEANNYAFFSKVHPDVKPYAIVDDDGSIAFDAMLFRFDKSSRDAWATSVFHHVIRPDGEPCPCC